MVRRDVACDGGAGLGGVGFGFFAAGVRVVAVVGVGCVAALTCGCASGGNGGGADAGGTGGAGGAGVVHRGEVDSGGGVHDGGGDGRVGSNRPMRLTDSETDAARGAGGGASTPAVAPVPAPAPTPVPEPVPVPEPEPVPEPVESAASVWRPGWWHEAATWTGGRIAVCRFADAGDMLQARTDAIYACLDAIELAGGDRSNVVVERADTQRLDDGTFRMFVRVTAPRVSGR